MIYGPLLGEGGGGDGVGKVYHNKTWPGAV